MPVAFLVLVFDDLRMSGDALLGGGRAGRRKRGLVGGKRLREHAVDLVGPAVVVANDLIRDMRHGYTCCVVAFRIAQRVHRHSITYDWDGCDIMRRQTSSGFRGSSMRLLGWVALATLVALAAAHAQVYPSRAITMVV